MQGQACDCHMIITNPSQESPPLITVCGVKGTEVCVCVIVSLSHDNHTTLISQPSRGALHLQQCEGYSRLCTCVMVFTCGVLQRKVECVVEEIRVKTAEIE